MSNRMIAGLGSSLLLAGIGAGCSNPADESTAAVVQTALTVLVENPATDVALGASLPIQVEQSRIEFIGSKVNGSHAGGFKAFTGAITLTAAGDEVAAVNATIDMDSTYSDNDRLTGHLKNADFFDVPTYPVATFESTAIQAAQSDKGTHSITGDLTLHGVTRSIQFPATIELDPEKARLESDFFINRRDFGIEYAGRPDDLIRDEVVIKLSVEAARPTGTP